MNWKLSLAFVSLVCSSAYAQSSVTLYGIVDDGIAYVNDSASTAKTVGSHAYEAASSVESRWGLTGSEDLGGGTRAIFTLENGFNLNNGTLSNGSRLFGRQAFVGLASSSLGQLRLGRQYDFGTDYIGPFASSKQWAGSFGSHVGDSDNLYNSFRLNNTIRYTIPSINGFVAGGSYAFSNQSSGGAGTGFANNRAYTFGAQYANGPVAWGASYLELDNPSAGNTGGTNTSGAISADYTNLRNIFYNNVERQRIAASGASYKLNRFTAALVYSWVGFEYADGTALHLSNYEANASYNITPALLVAAAFIYTGGRAGGGESRGTFATGNNVNWRQVNLGVDYALSKRTVLYSIAIWQRAGGDAQEAAIFNSGGLSGASSRQQLLFAAGIRTKF